MPAPIPPIVLVPSLRRRTWGGRRLETMRPSGRREPGEGPFGESWELADLPGGMFGAVSATDAGGAGSSTLRELMERSAEDVLGAGNLPADGRFPLLLKYLDAASPLSVQAHPRPAYAAMHPTTAVKHEGWFVMDATPGAVVYRGFRHPLDRGTIAELVRADRLHEELVAEPVARGDFVWLPSGTCHALGGGLLVAEVQTPSDTTFRVHDWGRHDPARPLHRAEAADAVEGTSAADLPAIVRTSRLAPLEAAGFRTWLLHRGERFTIELIEATSGTSLEVVTNGSAVAWMILEGVASIAPRAGGEARRLAAISTVLFPALGVPSRATFATATRWLRIELAQPRRIATA